MAAVNPMSQKERGELAAKQAQEEKLLHEHVEIDKLERNKRYPVADSRSDARQEISQIEFQMWNEQEVQANSVVECMNRDIYDLAAKQPMVYGILDKRMGVSQKRKVLCETCGKGIDDCQGHFGHIKLVLPIFHIGYLNQTYKIVSSICKTCGAVLLPPADKQKYLKRARNPPPGVQKKLLFRKVVEACKKAKSCYVCGAPNGQVRKAAGIPIKFTHEKVKKGKDDDMSDEDRYEDITPLTITRLFDLMSPNDWELLCVKDPAKMIVHSIPVPPSCIRPTVPMSDSIVNEDDLSVTLADVVFTNNQLKLGLIHGSHMRNIMDLWKWMQEQYATCIDSSISALQQPGQRPIRSICTRLKGKEGRFRGNLSGKRVDFSGRTVISPDPNVEITEVCVPMWTAKRLTYPEKVNAVNMDMLKQCVLNGNEAHPGASYVTIGGSKRSLGVLKKAFRRVVMNEIKIGDVVERHMVNGDIVLFNRQPSLHRMSIMAHKARVMEWKTFRFNECVCGPYNADFDGDEMNMHMPQTEEARTEAKELMGVINNIVTPKSGELVVHATQDFLTASFILTQRDVFLTRSQFCQLCASFTDGNMQIDIPPPSIVKPRELWTGKQVFSVLLRPNRNHAHVLINLEVEERNYSKVGKSMCKNDGYVLFRNSELLAGNLGKKTLGGSKKGLFFRLLRDNAGNYAATCMGRVARLSARYLGDKGFTLGIDDVMPLDVVQALKEKIAKTNYAKIDGYRRDLKMHRLQAKPGCTPAQTLEVMVNGELGDIRSRLGNEMEAELPRWNKPRIMATCGSKGSTLNLCQMMACLGQQNVGGARIKDGFVNRALPHFSKDSTDPKSRGFVGNSFYTGLEPTEFFFHTMGGREGLVDTAVKTAETGYMARRMMKALEDLSYQYDKTTRTSDGTIVQFIYGDDALAPAMMEGVNKPVDLNHTWGHTLATTRIPSNKKKAEFGEVVKVDSEKASAAAASSSNTPLVKQPVKSILKKRTDPAASPLKHSKVKAGPIDLLLPYQMGQLAKECIDVYITPYLVEGNDFFAQSLQKYIDDKAQLVASERERIGLPRCYDNDEEMATTSPKSKKSKRRSVSPVKNNFGADLETKNFIEDQGLAVRRYQIETFIKSCGEKYRRAITQSGEAVGGIAAQSISEPATQMTLKTFHFAGVASMNVTLGVPRIKEIINAAKKISTPIIEAHLLDCRSELTAKQVKGQIQRTLLKDIATHIKEVYAPGGVQLEIKFSEKIMAEQQITASMEDIKQAILTKGAIPSSLKLKEECITVDGPYQLSIKTPSNDRTKTFFELQGLKRVLPEVPISGIKEIIRVVVNKDDKDLDQNGDPKHFLLAEGYSLQLVMATPGVDAYKTESNHVEEVREVLGIEAARVMIMTQVNKVMHSYGIEVDARHTMLLGDTMTYRGEILGINRFGIAKMSSSTLLLASFERTTDHLFDASVHGKKDDIKGVSECIIMGNHVNLGTGRFALMYQPKPTLSETLTRPPLLQSLKKRKRFEKIEARKHR